MTAQRENQSRQLWPGHCSGAPDSGGAYFDSDLQAWVLKRHADVLAALQSSSLIPGRRELTSISAQSEERIRLQMREDVQKELSPSAVSALREELKGPSDELCRQLPVGKPIDLIAFYGRPLCLRFAAKVTGITQIEADKLEEHARIVSAATADPSDATLSLRAKHANETLRVYFNSGPEALRESGFVGLSQTLLRIIGGAWHALVQFPDQWSYLRKSPQSLNGGVEELMRYAGAISTLWRTAIEEVDINGVYIHKGDQVLLRLSSASHDPTRYQEPEKLDCSRHNPGHFVFGSGTHACVAANLIRMAAVAMTLPLLKRFSCPQLAWPVQWHGGSVMCSPASLWLILSEDKLCSNSE